MNMYVEVFIFTVDIQNFNNVFCWSIGDRLTIGWYLYTSNVIVNIADIMNTQTVTWMT